MTHLPIRRVDGMIMIGDGCPLSALIVTLVAIVLIIAL